MQSDCHSRRDWDPPAGLLHYFHYFPMKIIRIIKIMDFNCFRFRVEGSQ